MFRLKFHSLFVFLGVFHLSSSSLRRIKQGRDVESEKSYMVYLLGAPSSPRQYQGWLCGGAILSKDYVITSAACVEDVKHMYVIAGYKKYVAADKMEEDQCVLQKRKKVVQTCVPTAYQLDYNKTESWAKVDIAIVKVESPFDFTDQTFKTLCSYIPKPIEYNTEVDFPPAGEFAIILGWGHTKEFRQKEDLHDHNQAVLKYAPTKTVDEVDCAHFFKENAEMVEIITASMICTHGFGNLDEYGSLIKRSKPVGGCITQAEMLRGSVGKMCEYEEMQEIPPPVELDYGAYQEIVDTEVMLSRKQGNHSISQLGNETWQYNQTISIYVNITEKYENSTTENSNNTSTEANDTNFTFTFDNITKKDAIIDNFTKDNDNYAELNTSITKEHVLRTKQDKTRNNKIKEKVAAEVIDQDNATLSIKKQMNNSTFFSKKNESNFAKMYSTEKTNTIKPRITTPRTQTISFRKDMDKSDSEFGPNNNGKPNGHDIDPSTHVPTSHNEETPPHDQNATDPYHRHDIHVDESDELPGICQNDHGGPLVAWRGGSEVLVAIATLYKLNNKLECIGPFLYTKVSCNQKFIECILNQANPDSDKTRRLCDDPKLMGFEIVRRHISWVGHRDGPAENEQVQIRNQVPMSAFQPGYRQVKARLIKKQKYG